MGIAEKAATTLALVMHKLANNSAKYGALSDTASLLDASYKAPDDEAIIA